MKLKLNPVTRELCLFALPMLIGNILQSCYSMADMAVVGQFVGRDALAAVSNTSMIFFVSNSVCIGFTVGGGVLVAKYRGAGDKPAQMAIIRTLFALSALGGVLLTATGYLVYPPLLRLMNTPAEALPHAAAYMSIVSAGNLFVFGYNAVCSVMRGLGDSRRPLYLVAVTSAVNIFLDYLLVGFFRLGVSGAAIATVFSQAVSCSVAIWVLWRQGRQDKDFVFRFDKYSLSPDKTHTGDILRLGIPTALRSAALNLSYIVVAALFNGYGTAAAAAAGIGLKVNTFVAMPSWAVGQAVSTMAGHAMGARDPGRAGTIAVKGILASLFCNCIFLSGIHLFLRPFLGLFSPDPEVIESGARYLLICCSFNFIPSVVMNVLDNFATGAGAPFVAMLNTLLHSAVIRLGLSFLLTAAFDYGFTGLCIAESVSPVIPCLIGLTFFLRGRWRSET
ncbi:MAG: MATE family efflux transporter [Oscillospiraceae bacterium]|jgi:putative MATE family efflux protein|nr:MATE family efflux transporter [Oscillospiraceae bacterium]